MGVKGILKRLSPRLYRIQVSLAILGSTMRGCMSISACGSKMYLHLFPTRAQKAPREPGKRPPGEPRRAQGGHILRCGWPRPVMQMAIFKIKQSLKCNLC